MADPEENDTIFWYAPERRGILPLHDFHVSGSLARLIRQARFEVSFDTDFEAVIRACADRPSTWISEEIIQLYLALHRLGYAHSTECRYAGELAGGLYGVTFRGAFFGESMFYRHRDASKVALVHLVNHLDACGYVLLDTQYSTPHLARFGVIEVPRADYEQRLADALSIDVQW